MADPTKPSYRSIASRTAGRKLLPGEDVHHKDDNQSNNAPGNLEVKTHSAHSTHTGKTKGLRALRHSLAMQAKKQKLY